MERTLLGFRSGKRKGTLMPRLMRGYSPAQIADVADFFSKASAPSHLIREK